VTADTSPPPQDLKAFFEAIKTRARQATSLDRAAQTLADEFYERFKDLTVLVRVFATVPYAQVPAPVQRFVSALVEARGQAHLLREDTTVLTLMGTRGVLPAWNTRLGSRGHLGIPLVSPEFVDAIPMVARLLSELGVTVEGVAGGGEYVTRALGNLSGVFYVRDATEALDERERPIITSRDFVADHGVKTVFGFGGAYMMERSFTVIIVFARQTLDHAQVKELAPIANAFKAATMGLVAANRFFA
jgi:hypothetical protein